ncbi:MAG TPA: OmpA family protein [Patescibacteria group bacterium]|nr:OmpA family protein [Patescibacteria group bacterium]
MTQNRSWWASVLVASAIAVIFFCIPRPVSGTETEPFFYGAVKDITDAQSILVSLGHLKPGYKAGTLDEPTTRALVAFQDSHTLEPNGTLNWETMTQLLSHQPARDADGDGVPDTRDKCPNTPHGAKVDDKGCPRDADGDGVADGIDKCPDTPKGLKVDADGCPKDSDRDGVFDGPDQCPDTPKGAKVDEKGCPKDSDRDGVADGLDECPETPQGVKVGGDGCPLDLDRDGVFDGIDKCPDTPIGVKVDSTGCPVGTAPTLAPVAIPMTQGQSLVLEGVNFETNSAKLKPESSQVLDRVAESLQANPSVRVEVAGHTDSAGKQAYNIDLSKRRAASVRDYLVSKGVAGSRLETKGYGPAHPVADNATAEGRAKNRRVELKRIG